MFQLEKYNGYKSRIVCPRCRARHSFARYINQETNDYISPEVGRCNRESKCGYHHTPKMFFEANPELSGIAKTTAAAMTLNQTEKAGKRENSSNREAIKPDFIGFDVLRKTLCAYGQNSFVLFLMNLFPEDYETIREIIRRYQIGTAKNGKTIFWQIDKERNIRTGKIIAYDLKTGKRLKTQTPDWIHAEMKRQKLLHENFNLQQCFFGEQLLCENQSAPVAIVEAEKTAVIASICFPEFVWLACGSKLNLKPEKLKKFRNRKIILYPDADGFERWTDAAQDARKIGLPVVVSNLIENHATDEQKANGYNLADYLISEQQRVNDHNSFADRYNSALEKVTADENLMRAFNYRFEARKAELILYGGLLPAEAELKTSATETIRQLILTTAAGHKTYN